MTTFEQLTKQICGTGKGVAVEPTRATWHQAGGFAAWKMADVAKKLAQFSFQPGPEMYSSAADGAIGRAQEFTDAVGTRARVLVALAYNPMSNSYTVIVEAPPGLPVVPAPVVAVVSEPKPALPAPPKPKKTPKTPKPKSGDMTEEQVRA